jgi:DNA-binding transcriptional MerR regulator
MSEPTQTAKPSPTVTCAVGTEPAWRIDELSQLTGLSVDTIRFYQRERLIPPPEREGRHKVYGPAHVQRIERIRELQARRFSLAAIKVFLADEREGLVDGVFSNEPAATFDLRGLLARAGVNEAVAARLKRVGFLHSPTDFGRDDYDPVDADAFEAVQGLLNFGLPEDVVLDLVRIYVDGVEKMQGQVLELFRDRDNPTWTDAARRNFERRVTDASSELMPLVTRVVSYVHLRTLQRLTLRALSHLRAASAADAADEPRR